MKRSRMSRRTGKEQECATPAGRPAHPATVVQRSAPHPAVSPRPETPHAAAIAQRRPAATPAPGSRPPHAATLPGMRARTQIQRAAVATEAKSADVKKTRVTCKVSRSSGEVKVRLFINGDSAGNGSLLLGTEPPNLESFFIE